MWLLQCLKLRNSKLSKNAEDIHEFKEQEDYLNSNTDDNLATKSISANKTWLVVGIIAIVALTACNVIFFIKTLLWTSKTVCFKDSALILPCKDGVSTGLTNYCCYGAAESIMRLVTIMFAFRHTTPIVGSRVTEEHPKHGTESERRMAASFLLNTDMLKSGEMEWKIQNQMATLSHHRIQNSINKDGALIIPTDGWYLVYTGLTIKSECLRGKEQLVHGVSVRSKGKTSKNKVLENRLNRLRDMLVYQTSNIMSVVKLNMGDILKIWISNMSAIYKDDYTSVFGLYCMRQLT